MAQKVLVQLVDDLTGDESDDISTIQFGLDGVDYEIDLSEANAERLRKTLSDYVDAARRTGGRLKRGTRPAGTGSKSNAEAGKIREWAAENGYELSERGRIPSHVTEAYREAQSTTNTPPTNGGKRRSRAKKN